MKPFDFTPLAFKYAKEYSLNCIKVRILDLRKKLFNMRLKNDKLKQELEKVLPHNLVKDIEWTFNNSANTTKYKKRSELKNKYNLMLEQRNLKQKINDNNSRDFAIKKTYDKSISNSNEILKTNNNDKTNQLNDDWVVNLSSVQFNQIQMSVLKLDP